MMLADAGRCSLHGKLAIDGSTEDKLQVAKAEVHALKADRDNNSIEGNKISIF
jgi:hypothetical protein